MRNYLKDLYWLIRSKTFEILQLFHTRIFDYSNLRLARAHQALTFIEKNKHLNRNYNLFLKKKGLTSDQAPYGETPFIAMQKMVEGFAIEPSHTILELGCGSGKLSLWLAAQVGCRVIGVDHVPFFIEAAKKAQKEGGFRESEIEFICSDFQHAPLDRVDIVYFYGTGLGDAVYQRLCLQLSQMESPPWVITIGGPLSEYDQNFSVLQKVPVAFAWGWTIAYLNILGAKV